MIGIHQSVARAQRMAAVRRAMLVVGGFVLLAGVGITAGMVQAKRGGPPEATAKPESQTNTAQDALSSSRDPSLGPPDDTPTSDGDTTASDAASVQSATTTVPAQQPAGNTGNAFTVPNPDPPPPQEQTENDTTTETDGDTVGGQGAGEANDNDPPNPSETTTP